MNTIEQDEKVEECEYCKMGVEDGEALHWWKNGQSQCPVVQARQQRDEDDEARNNFYH